MIDGVGGTTGIPAYLGDETLINAGLDECAV